MKINPFFSKKELEQIPSISKDELERRMSLSLPCIIDKREHHNFLMELKPAHPTNQSFIWDMKTVREIGIVDSQYVFKNDEYVAIFVGDFLTLHKFGHPLFFKPSISEVLSQLPAILFNEERINGNKILYATEAWSDHAPSIVLNQEYHIAKTTVWHKINN